MLEFVQFYRISWCGLYCFADAVSHLLLIPECVAQGSHFTWGLGVGTCSLDAASATATVRNRPQPSATVANEVAMAVPIYGKFCKSGHFWRFETSRSLVSRGRRGTL